MIIDDYEGVTISIPVTSFIANGVYNPDTVTINYLERVKGYYENFYYGVRMLGGKLAVEKLQLNYRLTSLPRVNKYLDTPPTITQSDADKISRILNFEQEFNRSNGYALELVIEQNEKTVNLVNFYNFGLNNNELDLVTPYLTINSVDIPSLTDTLSLKVLKPTSFAPFANNYFTVFGSFVFKGRVQVEGVR